MNLVVQQGFIVLCLISIYLLLKLKSPPKNIVQLIVCVGSFMFALMVFELSLAIKPLPQLLFSYKTYFFIAAEVFFIIVLLLFRRVGFIWLIGSGSMCNLAVIVANNWRMPVFYGWDIYLNKAPEITEAWTVVDNTHMVMTSETHFNILGDWIYIGLSSPFYNMFDGIFSIGDVLIVSGLFLVAYKMINWWINNILTSKTAKPEYPSTPPKTRPWETVR